MPPSRASLEAILRDCGFDLSAAQYDALWAYHRLLREANAELNLTRIHQFENMVLKHYVDSLLVLKCTDLPSPLIDMGSGPGLPGIPLKIARPDVSMILAEPRGNRAEFLRSVCDRLNLQGVEVIARKVNRTFPRKARGVITRAVASIPETLQRVAGCLEVGGRMLFMKGPDCSDEIDEARANPTGLFRLVADHRYTIPGTPHDRRLVIYERLEGEAPSTEATSVAMPAYAGPVREVTSDTNPTFKIARDLLSGRGIRKHGQALMAGSRIVSEVLANHADHVLAWLTDNDGPPPPAAADSGLTWLRLSPALFAEIDSSGTRSPLLLTRVPVLPEWQDASPWPPGCTLFVPFQDPENVGAAIRSAAAFGVSRIVLLREAAHPFHPKSARAAGPALFAVPMEQGPSIRELSSVTVPILALSADGTDLATHSFPAVFGLVAGMEGPGLPDHLRQGLALRIPIAAGVESLNAATATAIALYEWARQSAPPVTSAPPSPDAGVPAG
ncbi:MAG: rRNA ((527)-N(7))-methyltransferase GidB [Planctomycetota bacterium]|nr:rRNA ((527)-N(7))-methyltransferase GidB [Planctomycetota bacterium]